MFNFLTKSGLCWLWLTLIMLFIDQLTKYWVVDGMSLYQSHQLLPFFSITYVHNLGAAFSFLDDAGGWQRWFFSAIAALASVIFCVWLAKTPKENKLLGIALALMLSGAMGNLIDRLMLGYVIDFLDFYLGSHHWPAFNVADSAIFVGAVLMVFDSIKNNENAEVVK